MQTVYKLNATELDEDFLQEVKTTFGSKSIQISICEAQETDPPKSAGQGIAEPISFQNQFVPFPVPTLPKN